MMVMKYITPVLLFILCHSMAYASECVDVKNRGKVSLSQMQCSTISGLELIERICYDKANSYLVVQIVGQYSEYCGVQELYFGEFMKAPKKGQYLETHIRNGIFDCSIFQPPSYAGQCK